MQEAPHHTSLRAHTGGIAAWENGNDNTGDLLDLPFPKQVILVALKRKREDD